MKSDPATPDHPDTTLTESNPSPSSRTQEELLGHRSAMPRLLCSMTVFSASLTLYLWTVAPTVTLVDSGELIVAARSLGVAHPPGFPLYTLLAYIATLVPIGGLAMRVNLASGLFGAIACGALTLAVVEILLSAGFRIVTGPASQKTKRKRATRDKPQTHPPVEPAETVLIFAPALISGLSLAFSRTLWTYSTIAEVYALNTALLVIVLALMLRWRRINSSASASKKPQPNTGRRSNTLYIAALLFGLGLGVHHVTLGLTLPAFALLVYLTQGAAFFRSNRLLKAVLFVFAGLSIYVYLPLAAASSPIINWGNPTSLERFWWHITGRQYQVFFSPSLGTMFRQLGGLFDLTTRQYGPWWFPGALLVAGLGLVTAFRKDKSLFWFLVLIVLTNLPYALNYEIAEDKDAYYLPTFVVLSLAVGLGAHALLRNYKSVRRLSFVPPRLLVAALLLLPVVALLSNFPYNNRRSYYVAEDYVTNILRTVDQNGLLLTVDWQVYSPMLYVTELERVRSDAIVIDLQHLRRSWYFDQLKRSYPELIEAVKSQSESFLEDLHGWEQDPDLYDKDISLNQRINTRYNDLILSIVRAHIQNSPVYITQELAVANDGQYVDITRALNSTYQLIPQGLVFQLSTVKRFVEPDLPQLQIRGLVDGTLRFEKDDVVNLKVLPVYISMAINRGSYFAAYGDHERAIDAFKQALVLDPGSRTARRLLDQSQLALRAIQQSGPKKD